MDIIRAFIDNVKEITARIRQIDMDEAVPSSGLDQPLSRVIE